MISVLFTLSYLFTVEGKHQPRKEKQKGKYGRKIGLKAGKNFNERVRECIPKAEGKS